MHKPQDILRSVWGYERFRPLQGEIIASVLVGRDTLALLPTGGGKSLCYQVPALSLDGVTLVVSPLIALMKDQVSALRQRGVAAAAIFSGLRQREIDARLDSAAAGQTRLLYLSPERLSSPAFLGRLERMPVGLVAIDEAHCIAEWGHDFRPAYLRIAALRERLPGVPFLALTASATPKVQEEIAERLELSDPARFVGSFARDNLVLGVRMADNKGARMLDLFRRVSGSALVYLRSRRKVEQWADWLRRNGVSAQAYHAGLPPETRHERHEAWMNGATRVVVCTTAFGMGIDKGDVRLVLHLDAPESLEAYYQEAGRGGRDGARAWAAMFLDAGDRRSLEERMQQGPPDVNALRRLYQQLADHCSLAIGAGEGEAYAFEPRAFARKIGMPPRRLTEALRILEQEGLLALNEAAWLPPRAWMKVGKAEVYRFQVEHRQLDDLVKALLRSTPGIFDHHAAIDEGRLSRQLGQPVQAVRSGLAKLAEYQLIDYLPRADTPQLIWLRPREDARYLRLDREALERRRERHRARLQAVLDYLDLGLPMSAPFSALPEVATAAGMPDRGKAPAMDCRMAFLQAYFGEDAPECGRCDRCLARRNADADPADALLRYLRRTGTATIPELVGALRPMAEREVLQALRWSIDRGLVRREADDRVSCRP
jgi:ATP-dependent DNA helicase RecQ